MLVRHVRALFTNRNKYLIGEATILSHYNVLLDDCIIQRIVVEVSTTHQDDHNSDDIIQLI